MKKTLVSAIAGVVAGFANGLFGAGGGMILVPAMQRFLEIDTHKSHATAITVILPLSIVSMFVYLKGGYIEWNVVVFISAGGVLGSFIGAKLLNRIPKKALHKIFGLCMAAAAVRMIL